MLVRSADGDDVALSRGDGLEPDARPVVQITVPTSGVVRDEPLLAVEYDFALAE